MKIIVGFLKCLPNSSRIGFLCLHWRDEDYKTLITIKAFSKVQK